MLKSWFIDRPIGDKFILCFGALIAVGLCVGAATFRSLSRIETAEIWTTHTNQVLDVSKSLVVNILTQENDVRGYQLKRDESFLERAKSENDALQIALQKMKALTVDNASQQARLAVLSTLIDTWRAQLQIDTASEPAKVVQATGAQGILNRVLRKLEEIDKEEGRLFALRTKAQVDAFDSAYVLNRVGPFCSICVALLLGWILNRSIRGPIARLTVAMRKLAEGDTSIAIPNTDWKEEIGEMSRALEVFRMDMIDATRLRSEQQETRLRTQRERAGLIASMADRFEEVVGSIVQAVSKSTGEMQGSAESLLEVAGWTATEVKVVAESTKQASQTMQIVAKETENLLGSVGEINVQLAHSADVAGQAVAEADRTTGTIEGLAQSANRIGVIVGLINDIARQTNLLALNATIEAARAGDAGRGFAVVAAEVQTLANQTAGATDDIRRQIEGIQSAATGSVAAIRQISQTIGEMARVTAEVTTAGDAQGDATRTMVEGTHATAKATADVSLKLDQVTEGAVTTGAAANKVLAAAKDLARQAELLRTESHRFAKSVRTG